MFPEITLVSVTDQMALIWAEPIVVSLLALSLAFAVFPRAVRAIKGLGRR